MKKIEKIILGMLFLICVLFFMAPILIRIPFIHKLISWYFSGLSKSELKSSYMSSIGGAIGVIMTIISTLFIQKMLDKNTEKKLEIKKRKDIEDNMKIIFYDLKTALCKMIVLGCMFNANQDNIHEFFNLAGYIKICLDNDWRKRVILLNEVLDEETVKKITETYYSLSVIEHEIYGANENNPFLMILLVAHIAKFFDDKKVDLRDEYKQLIKTIAGYANIQDYDI